ncbi:MAG: putative DNA binding domain-containing protein [Bacteroidales bacterium]|nr:putative DNA binding domain-containing protein [Bacteroidales bacterium]
MTEKEFENILKLGESYTVEFKRNISKELKNEICSFLNSSGGKFFIGIEDDNTVCGVNIDNKISSQIQTLISVIQPNPKLDISEYTFKKKQIFIIDCKTDERKPYMSLGVVYVRRGANSQKLLSPDELKDFFQKENKIYFEKLVNENFSYPEDFDSNRFNDFIENANISSKTSQKQIIENLQLFSKNSKLINAGILFFAKDVQKYFEHASIRCLLFKGTNKSIILDDKLIGGSLPEQYKGALQFLKTKLELRYIIKTARPRIEKYEIPEVVFKEAIINALVHRDYFEAGGKIHIEIYDNRVEITNPGGLVNVIKDNEFGKRSVSRNPIIFNFFQRLNLVEQVGSGISRMFDEMRMQNLPAPHFLVKGIFSVTLYRPINFNSWMQSPENKLTKIQTQILIEIYKNSNITQSEISSLTDVGKTTVYNNIKKLKQLGILERIGSDKSGYWTIYYK